VKELAEAQKSESKARDKLAREQEERRELEQKVRESEKARMEAVQLAEAARGLVATTAGEARTAVDGRLEGLRKELSSKASELSKAYLRNEKLQRTIDDLRAKNDDLRDELAVDELISPPHDFPHLAAQRPPTFPSSSAALASDSNAMTSFALSSSLSNPSAVLPHSSSSVFAAPAPSLPSSTGADVSHSQVQAEHHQTQLILVQTQAKVADADRMIDKLNDRLKKLYAKVQNLYQEKLQLKSDQTQATSRAAELAEELRLLRQTLETINTSSGRTDEEMQEEVGRATTASEERVLILEAQQEELKEAAQVHKGQADCLNAEIGRLAHAQGVWKPAKDSWIPNTAREREDWASYRTLLETQRDELEGRVREMQELVEGFLRKSVQAEEVRRKEEKARSCGGGMRRSVGVITQS
jgi:chromosome segregation ATPase